MVHKSIPIPTVYSHSEEWTKEKLHEIEWTLYIYYTSVELYKYFIIIKIISAKLSVHV